jgi:hypothetical protein
VKQNRVIHLQVKESQLLKFGKVNEVNSRWVPIKAFSILDKGIKNGVDYHTLAFDRREVDLDDVIAPAGHVVVSEKQFNDFFELSRNILDRSKVQSFRYSSEFGSPRL